VGAGAKGSALIGAIQDLELVGLRVYIDDKHGRVADMLAGIDEIGVRATNNSKAVNDM
jgi:hypothetical protein